MVLNYDDSASRRAVEQCFRTSKVIVNPIIDWTDGDVWEYLNEVERVPHCELYDKGYKRLGCIGCPMSTKAAAELEAYPKYKANYIRAFDRMVEMRIKDGMKTDVFVDGESVMDWWIHEEKRGIRADGQVSMWEEMEHDQN